MGIIITDDEHRQQVEDFKSYRHAKYRQVDSVDPKQKNNSMIKVDAKRSEMSDEKWIASMQNFGG